jgi:pentatricopeptide repeat protein
MKRKSMPINLITYNSAITALSKASRQNIKYSNKINNQYPSIEATNVDEEQLWIRGLDLLEQIKSDGLEPDGFSYSAAISCCGTGGRWKEALDLIKTMQKGGPKTRPSKVAYTAAICT